MGYNNRIIFTGYQFFFPILSIIVDLEYYTIYKYIFKHSEEHGRMGRHHQVNPAFLLSDNNYHI